MKRLTLIGGIIAVLLLMFALAIIVHKDNDTSAKPPPASKPSVTGPSSPAETPTVEVVAVVAQTLSRTVRLPGELQPYQSVVIFPRVTGFLEWIGVDRGSRVKEGQLLARLVAPELKAQRAEAEAKLGIK